MPQLSFPVQVLQALQSGKPAVVQYSGIKTMYSFIAINTYFKSKKISTYQLPADRYQIVH